MSITANALYDMVARGIIDQDYADRFTIEDRRLTFKEWWNRKARHKGDPRVHYEPIKIQLYDIAPFMRDVFGITEEEE